MHSWEEGSSLEKSLQRAARLCMVPVAFTCQLKAEEHNANWEPSGKGAGNEATGWEALHRVSPSWKGIGTFANFFNRMVIFRVTE